MKLLIGKNKVTAAGPRPIRNLSTKVLINRIIVQLNELRKERYHG